MGYAAQGRNLAPWGIARQARRRDSARMLRIREIRLAKGLTFQQVADRMGEPTTASTVQKIESGKKWASREMLAKVAAALGVEVHELFQSAAPTSDAHAKLNDLMRDATPAELEEAARFLEWRLSERR